MADRYWIGGSGNWSDASNHWASISGSTGDITYLPTSADNVYFDANSFDTSGTITLDVNANCKNFDWTGLDSSVWMTSTVNSLYIYGDVSLNAGLTYRFTGTGYTYLRGLDTSVSIKTNAASFNTNRLYIDSSKSTFIHYDDASFGSSTIYLANGVWDTNSYTISTTGLISYLTGVKTFRWRESIINCNNFGEWKALYGSNTYVDASNSTLNCNGFFISYSNRSPYYGSVTSNYYVQTGYSDVRFKNLTLIPLPTRDTYHYIAMFNNFIDNLLTIHGSDSSVHRVLIAAYYSDTYHSPYKTNYRLTISAGDVSMSNVGFRDISTSGLANWDLSNIPGGSADYGNNNGITFTPSVSCYFKATSGTFYYSDASNWVSESGGDVYSRIPLPQDNAIFDSSSFTGDSSIQLNLPYFGTLDTSAINLDQSINLYLPLDLRIHGNFILGNKINYVNPNSYHLYLYGRPIDGSTGDIISIDAKGKLINSITSFVRGNVVYHFISDYNCSNKIEFNGTTYTNDYTIRMSAYQNTYYRIIYLGDSSIYCSGSWYGNVNQILYPGTSRLYLSPGSASSTFYASSTSPGNGDFNKVYLNGQWALDYGAAIKNLYITSGTTIKVNSGYTWNIGKIEALGTQEASIAFIGNNSTVSTITVSNTDFSQCDYCDIAYLVINPSDRWYAGKHSRDLGNNGGWVFDNYSLSGQPIIINI